MLALLSHEPGRAHIEIDRNEANRTIEVFVRLHFEVEQGHVMDEESRKAHFVERIRAGVDDFFHQVEIFCREAE